jgi:hypothetical protein
VAITETGWHSERLTLYLQQTDECATFFDSDPSFQASFLQFLIYSAYIGDFDLITWWSDRDMIDGQVMSTCYPPATPPSFPECDGDFWCLGVSYDRANSPAWWQPELGELIFKGFGSLGLRGYDGTPKPQLDIWNGFRALPVSPP